LQFRDMPEAEANLPLVEEPPELASALVQGPQE